MKQSGSKKVRWSASAVAVVLGLVLLAVPVAGGAQRASRTGRAFTVSSRLGAVKHVSANGLSMGYRTGGHGPWLIIVMGRSGTMAEWDPLLMRQLTAHHHVVVFDNRGMGTTNDDTTPTSDVTIELMADDTLALADALGIHRFDLMGWSMGGEISQQVAVDAPRRVMKLVLCATGSGGPTEKLPSATVQKLMSEPNLPTKTLFKLSFPQTAAGKKAASAYAARVLAQYKHDHLPSDSFSTTPAGLAGQQNARTQWTSSSGGVYGQLHKLPMHVLVMWGNKDVVDPPANDRLIMGQLRHVTHKVFAGAGHAFLFQDAKQVGAAVNRFLN